MLHQASVGHNFDGMLGQQHINQHAVVVLGVPDTQLAKHRHGPFPDEGAEGVFAV